LAKTILGGRYLIVDEAFLREKANRTDPRNIFYRAMLEHRTYEGYEDAVRGIAVTVPTYRTGPVNGTTLLLQYSMLPKGQDKCGNCPRTYDGLIHTTA
jgi:hypothetical protein